MNVFSVNNWARASHILPGQYLDPRRRRIKADFGLSKGDIGLAWPFQFTTPRRRKSPHVHRWVGTFLLLNAAAGQLGIIAMGACLYVRVTGYVRMSIFQTTQQQSQATPAVGGWGSLSATVLDM